MNTKRCVQSPHNINTHPHTHANVSQLGLKFRQLARKQNLTKLTISATFDKLYEIDDKDYDRLIMLIYLISETVHYYYSI